MTRFFIGLILVLALGLMGCSETAGTDGSAGTGGAGGDGGSAGSGGDGGSAGNGGGMGDVFPCTEQGIRDAIAEGGGPHTFSCDSPITTRAAIVINNDVTLDGDGTLTIEGQDDHRIFLVASEVTAELRRLTVTEGFAGVLGGGGILNRGELILADVTVSGNRGGGIVNEGTLSITDSTIVANSASSPANSAGGLDNTGIATLMSTTVSNNGARFGGGGIRNTGTLVATNSNISENTGENTGGGIVNGGTLTLANTTVSDNTAESSEGGGIANAGTLTLLNSTVSGNAAPIGGGVTNNGDPNTTSLVMTNSTVSGNTATLDGGGIYNELASATLINSTVVRNTAEAGSAIYSHYAASRLTLARTVVEGACALDDTNLLSSGHNIESPGDTCGFAEETDQPNTSAETLKLGPLRENGGATQTHALAHDSMAVDVVPAAACVDGGGSPLVEDQRGVERPQGETCDVGAFELEHCSNADDCDDYNDCTDNECTPGGLCSYPLVPDGTSCDDAGIQGTCFEGDCVHP